MQLIDVFPDVAFRDQEVRDCNFIFSCVSSVV